MRILHILKTEPEEIVEKFIEAVSNEEEFAVAALYQEDVDWARLVTDIFAYDRVICWW